MSLRMPTLEIWFSMVATKNKWLFLPSMALWRTISVVALTADLTFSVLVNYLGIVTLTLVLVCMVVPRPWVKSKSSQWHNGKLPHNVVKVMMVWTILQKHPGKCEELIMFNMCLLHSYFHR